MQLGLGDAARLLDASEEQIYAWIREGTIPFYEVSEQYRFHRAELLEWATARGRPVSVEIFHAFLGAGAERIDLADALAAGGVHHGVAAKDERSLFDALVAHLPIPDPAERRVVLEVLSSAQSALVDAGGGIAVPHVRSPIVLHGARPAIVLSFLEAPLELRAAGEEPISAVFLIAAPTPKIHLRLLSELSSAIHDAGFRDALARRAPAEEILREARRIDASFAEKRSAGPR